MVLRMKVAVHSEDIDGISCAALFLLIDPNATIKFLTVYEANVTDEEFDFIADLPKCAKCRVNIDHHKSNLDRLIKSGRLSSRDLIDPSAPSAAMLVMKYFKLENNPIAREIVEIANKADRGILTEKTILLDKIIKLHIRDQNYLLKIAEVLARMGSKFDSDNWFKKEAESAKRLLKKYEAVIESTLSRVLSRNLLFVIFDVRKFPFFIAKDFAQRFAQNGGCVGISVYMDPLLNRLRCSIRVGRTCNFSADILASKLGGGGHEKAAGAILSDIYELIKHFIELVEEDKIIAYIKVPG